MWRRLILVTGIFFWFEASGQNDQSLKSLQQEADQFYADEQYNLAIQYYRELTDRNFAGPAVAYRLAECYRKVFLYTEAEAYYFKVNLVAPKEYPLALYYYGLMLKFNGNFDEAIASFDDFIALHQQERTYHEFVEQAIIDKAGSEIAKTEMASGKSTMPLVQLVFNTVYNDYAPAVRDSANIVITSGRIASNRVSIDERFGEAFTDNYYFERTTQGWQDKTKQLFSVTNSRFNDGSGCFNRNGDKYYFTICGQDGPQCKLFVTVYLNNKWSEPLALNSNINFKSTESKHPALHGGDTLIFASNRPGGHGGFDLWMSINAGGEQWGPAINLGTSVNTKLNEVSPALTAYNNVLFFASDGHPGHGGLDLFMAKRMSTQDTLLYNLDLPFNSNRDDAFVSFSDHALYWSSNRSKGLGGFDIYSVKIPSVIAFISKISLKKRDSRRLANLQSRTATTSQQLNLNASRLEEKVDYDDLTYEKKRVVQELLENRINNKQSGADQFGLTIQEYQQLQQIAEERYQDLISGKVSTRGYLIKVTAATDATKDFTVNGFLEDSLTGNRMASRKILLTDRLGEVIKTTMTNEEGKFRFTDVSPKQELYIRIERIPSAELTPVVRDIKISVSNAPSEVRFENVYFDFDHYNIRPEASRVLDALAEQLIDHPAAQVEVFAYADDRGSMEYNLRLTQKRGQSVVNYLKNKGVDQTGIAIIAKGKREAQNKTTMELQRQLDRRVELYVNGISITLEPVQTGRSWAS
jgi:outer membrane protein OmpA-like peptidoglycan-associated protein/tetratricopeptide (TPR) repeat protein